MFTEVNEIVEVIVVFKKNVVLPSIVKWGSREYKIKKINMVHKLFEGQALIYCFSVSDDHNFFKLLFDTQSMRWKLEQVYHEG